MLGRGFFFFNFLLVYTLLLHIVTLCFRIVYDHLGHVIFIHTFSLFDNGHRFTILSIFNLSQIVPFLKLLVLILVLMDRFISQVVTMHLFVDTLELALNGIISLFTILVSIKNDREIIQLLVNLMLQGSQLKLLLIFILLLLFLSLLHIALEHFLHLLLLALIQFFFFLYNLAGNRLRYDLGHKTLMLNEVLRLRDNRYLLGQRVNDLWLCPPHRIYYWFLQDSIAIQCAQL